MSESRMTWDCVNLDCMDTEVFNGEYERFITYQQIVGGYKKIMLTEVC